MWSSIREHLFKIQSYITALQEKTNKQKTKDKQTPTNLNSTALLKKGPSSFYYNHDGTTSNLVDMSGDGNPDLLHHTVKSLKNYQSEISLFSVFFQFLQCSYSVFLCLSIHSLGKNLAYFTPNIPLYEKMIIITRLCQWNMSSNTESLYKAVDTMPDIIKGSNFKKQSHFKTIHLQTTSSKHKATSHLKT